MMRDVEPASDVGASAAEGAARDGTLPVELLVWLSPVFPVGGFAYSQGLETAVARRWVTDGVTLKSWMSALIGHGALANDLVLIGLVMRADGDAEIAQLAELAAALQPSAERAAEAVDQGRNFRVAFEAGWAAAAPASAGWDDRDITLPVAVALAARAYALAPAAVLEGYAVAQINNLVSAAIRLGAIGQYAGQRLIAEVLPELRRAAGQAMSAGVDDLGTASFGADLATMLHETQQPRLFRS